MQRFSYILGSSSGNVTNSRLESVYLKHLNTLLFSPKDPQSGLQSEVIRQFLPRGMQILNGITQKEKGRRRKKYAQAPVI